MHHFNKLLISILCLGLLFGRAYATTPPDTVLIDFGDNLSPAPWNNLSNPRDGAIADMLTTTGLSSGIGIAVSDSFNNINLGGTQAPDPSLQLPASASGDSFFGNTAPFGGQTQPTGAVVLSGLNLTTAYNFTIFASRNSVADNREAQYTITGNTVQVIYLNASNNTANVATLNNMRPASDGTITIEAAPGPNNTNGSGFYYLGTIRMVYTLTRIDSIGIDFGNNLTPAPWNNVADPVAGTIADMTNLQGLTTGIGIAVNDPFNNINLAGTLVPDTTLGFPSTSTGDSFFGNVATFGGQMQPTGGVLFSGLDTATAYTFTIFASRASVSDNREARYLFTGKSVDSVYLDASNNTANVTVMADIYPDTSGQISLLASPGPNNTNGSGFYYLGAIQLTYPVPLTTPPAPEALVLTSPNGGERWEVGKQVFIRWESENVVSMVMEYSTDDGQNWTAIDTIPGVGQKYLWTVPNDTSDLCLVRLTSSQFTVVSDSNFKIATDNGRDCRIIVLGSSTAAGTGPSSPDSAWVKRYSDYLTQLNTDFRITNLAQGGFTTYNILPTGTQIPVGVNQTVNNARNITAALSINPDAIIINMPSNDAAIGYPVANQLANYDLILGAAADTVPIWITTPQPRNFNGDATKIQIQLDMLDSTFARFDTFAIDFWTDLAVANALPNPIYDSGDGIHLNNAAHKILFERVIGAGIHTYLLNKTQVVSSIDPTLALFSSRIYPNPFADIATVEINLAQASRIEVVLLDLQGRRLSTLADGQMPAGVNSIGFDRQALSPGIYLLQIRHPLQVETYRVVITD